jgi:hypothetical protein
MKTQEKNNRQALPLHLCHSFVPVNRRSERIEAGRTHRSIVRCHPEANPLHVKNQAKPSLRARASSLDAIARCFHARRRASPRHRVVQLGTPTPDIRHRTSST